MRKAPSEGPVLKMLAAMTAQSVERCWLDANALVTARIAALAALDASVASYVMYVGCALDIGVTSKQIQSILIAIAPIVGTPRTAAAAQNLSKALGVAIVALEDELDDGHEIDVHADN